MLPLSGRKKKDPFSNGSFLPFTILNTYIRIFCMNSKHKLLHNKQNPDLFPRLTRPQVIQLPPLSNFISARLCCCHTGQLSVSQKHPMLSSFRALILVFIFPEHFLLAFQMWFTLWF